MIVIEVLTPQKFAEEFTSLPVFSEVTLVTGALPQRMGEAPEARSSGWESLNGLVGGSCAASCAMTSWADTWI